MTVKIREVRSRMELNAFISFPHKLYARNPYHVPALRGDELNTLRRDRNPAFEFCEARYWLAVDGNKIVGRVAGIINQLHIEKWGQRYARFGWIDFVDDREVSLALLAAVENWAENQGMQALHGPLGFSNMDHAGMLVEGFNELATQATIYNYPYYADHLEAAGYVKDIDWVEYEMPVTERIDEKFFRLAEKVKNRYNLSLLEVTDKKDLLPYAHELFDMLVEEYKHLYAAVPLTPKQVDAYINQYFGFISPDFVPVVLDADGRMVAFGIAMPSLSRALQKSCGRLFPFGFIHLMRALRKNDRADLYLVAIRKEYQGRGVNSILITKMFKVFKEFGIKVIESNPELENNVAVQAQWRHFDRRQHKRRRCFIKYLE